MKKTELQGKKVLVFGSGISGIGAVKLLETVQADVVLYDGNESLKQEEVRAKLPKKSKCEIVLGELKQELIDSLDLVVMSPGVPLDIEPVERLKVAGLPIWGEVELAYCMGDGTVLAITGTNGKTTTTALLWRNHKGLCRFGICCWKYWKRLYGSSFFHERRKLYSSRNQQFSVRDHT